MMCGGGSGRSVITDVGTTLANMSERSCNAVCWALPMGAQVNAGAGCWSAWMTSRSAAVAASAYDVAGILTWAGNHGSVSAMCSKVES